MPWGPRSLVENQQGGGSDQLLNAASRSTKISANNNHRVYHNEDVGDLKEQSWGLEAKAPWSDL